MYCRVSDGTCRVSSFTSRFSFTTVVTMLLACLVCAIGVVAGVGGGGILVPMFAALLSLPMQSCVALSQSTICGQSTLNMYFAVQQTFASQFPSAPSPATGVAGDGTDGSGLRKTKREWKRPLINYQYLSLMLPLGLIGTLVGGLISKVISDLLRLFLLIVLLSLVLYRTVQKMRVQYREDTAHGQRATATDVVVSADGEAPEGAGGTQNAAASPVSPATLSVPAATSTKLEDTVVEKVDQPQYPVYELSTNFGCFFVLLTFNILRSYATCSSFWYWMCVLIPLACLSGCFYYSRMRLERMARATVDNLDVQDPSRPVNEDSPLLMFAWNEYNNMYYPLVAVIAGAAAAMLGIGGGLVLGFVLYEVGLSPSEASVTGGMATFFIAFSAGLQLLVTGSLIVDFGIVFYGVGLVSTAIGTYIFKVEIKKRGWNFLFLGALAFIVGGSLLVLGIYSTYNAVIVTKDGGSALAFGRLCANR
ncbi:hypothetical protein STCU_03335 [Strigomonas culicis]|uniref:Sulfite exporter TauE/SafE n=1 Tax=Strigomonas culicis TaxID=28005 RepID=S9URZ6_9TRYP|nr:hypothetical protein STCU_03335 [Strigomonas culicis]|eukprot:EPY31678.1 hypothetical protein STCU_03335 [Strigomonas culicis]